MQLTDLLEIWTSSMPLVLPDAPLGMYAQPTLLGLLVGTLLFALIAVGAVVAFRRPGFKASDRCTATPGKEIAASERTQERPLVGRAEARHLAMWPFTYYGIGSTVRHVDLLSGLLETMAEVGGSAAPVAIVNG